MDNTFLEQCSDLPVREFTPGERLLEEGVAGSASIYILKEGEVEVTKGGAAMATVKQPGAILGEISALLGGAPLATATAVTACQFHVVEDQKAFLAQPEVALALARVLAARLGATDRLLAAARNEAEGRSDPQKAKKLLRGLEAALVSGWD